jgi:hypothetical protein
LENKEKHIAAIMQMAESGITNRAIAKSIGISICAVADVIKKATGGISPLHMKR